MDRTARWPALSPAIAGRRLLIVPEPPPAVRNCYDRIRPCFTSGFSEVSYRSTFRLRFLQAMVARSASNEYERYQRNHLNAG